MAIVAKHLIGVIDELVAHFILSVVPAFASMNTCCSSTERAWPKFNFHDFHPLEWQIFVAEAHLFAEVGVCQLRLLFLLVAAIFGTSQVLDTLTHNLCVP